MTYKLRITRRVVQEQEIELPGEFDKYKTPKAVDKAFNDGTIKESSWVNVLVTDEMWEFKND